MLKLSHDLHFQDLYEHAGLAQLDAAFLQALAAIDAPLCEKLATARRNPATLEAKQESALFLELVRVANGRYIAELAHPLLLWIAHVSELLPECCPGVRIGTLRQ